MTSIVRKKTAAKFAALLLLATFIPAMLQGADGKTLYMDVHHLGAGKVTADAVAEAHKKDLAVEKQFGVHFLEYWFDEQSGRVHCLVEAPSPEAVKAAHAKAHGMLPVEIHEVVEGH